MEHALREQWANPSSIHRPGQMARQQIELARKHLGALIGARPRQLTLCGSGTEAIDLAIRGFLLASGRIGARRAREPGAILTSKVEHAAVRELAAALEKEEGVRVLWADLGADGVVDVASVRRLLDANPDTALVSVQWANNETGAVQPVREIGELCVQHRAAFHCDATQWVGKMPTSVDVGSADAGGATGTFRLVCDLLTFSPHKFHGPKGVGVLWGRPGVRTAPLIHGEQELGRRGGTENVPGIIGAGVAAQIAAEWLFDPERRRAVGALRDRFERGVLEGYPDATVNGPRENAEEQGTRRLWNTTNIAFPRLEAEALLLLLSERGVCASAGAACSSGSLDPSPVLLAMGVGPERAHGSLRFSLSKFTTREEVDEAVGVVVASAKRLHESMEGVGRDNRR